MRLSALIAAIMVASQCISISAAASRQLFQANTIGNCSLIRPACKGSKGVKFNQYQPFSTGGYNASVFYRGCQPSSTCLTFVSFPNMKITGIDRTTGVQLPILKKITAVKSWKACSLLCANYAAEEPLSQVSCQSYSYDASKKICRLLPTTYNNVDALTVQFCPTARWRSGYGGEYKSVRSDCGYKA